MGLESVKKQFAEENLGLEVMEFDVSTATVELAAEAVGVEPGMIAKTMALRLKDRDVLVVAKGDVRLDNKKSKQTFGCKVKMIGFDEVEEITGHPVGGVCPFGLKQSMDVYLDESMKVYEVVYPAGGTPSSAVKISLGQLEEVTNGQWIDICKTPQPEKE